MYAIFNCCKEVYRVINTSSKSQLILKGKYLVRVCYSHTLRDYKISQCDYKFFRAMISTWVRWNQSQRVSIEMIKHHSNNEQTLVYLKVTSHLTISKFPERQMRKDQRLPTRYIRYTVKNQRLRSSLQLNVDNISSHKRTHKNRWVSFKAEYQIMPTEKRAMRWR